MTDGGTHGTSRPELLQEGRQPLITYLCPICQRRWADPAYLRSPDFTPGAGTPADIPRPRSRICRSCDIDQEKRLWADFERASSPDQPEGDPSMSPGQPIDRESRSAGR